MKTLVVIPARGGSKGVPRKNIKFLSGKPLIQYTIEAARGVFADNQIYVSTDDEEIKSVVERLGLSVPFLRPEHLATDTAGTNEVLLHAIDSYNKLGYQLETIVLLQVTSPFRTAKHLSEALMLFDRTCDMVASVRETKANPYYTLLEENVQGWLMKSKSSNFSRRQDCPPVYELSGAIYIINVKSLRERPLYEFKKVRKYLMDEASSHDIDSILDWKVAELLVNEVFY